MTLTFQSERLKSWSCFLLRWGKKNGKSILGEKDKELSFGNVNFEMPMKHLGCILGRKLNVGV